MLHGARVDDDVLVGMGSIVMNGAHIGSGSIVAAGAVVTPGTEVPPGRWSAACRPRWSAQATDDDLPHIRGNAASYIDRLTAHAGSARSSAVPCRRPARAFGDGML